MRSRLCNQCLTRGHCRHLQSKVVSDAELSNPEFIRDLRRHALGLRFGRDAWLDKLADLYRDYPGRIVNVDGCEAALDFEPFEQCDSIAEWFREFACTPCPDDVIPRVRREAWERVRVLATVLRAVAPEQASLWGVRPANDHTTVWQAGNFQNDQSRRNPPRGCPLGACAVKERFDRQVGISPIMEGKSPDVSSNSGAD